MIDIIRDMIVIYTTTPFKNKIIKDKYYFHHFILILSTFLQIFQVRNHILKAEMCNSFKFFKIVFAFKISSTTFKHFVKKYENVCKMKKQARLNF